MVKKLLPAMTVCLAGILILSCVMIGRTLTQSQREIDDFQDLASMTETAEGSAASDETDGLEHLKPSFNAGAFFFIIPQPSRGTAAKFNFS